MKKLITRITILFMLTVGIWLGGIGLINAIPPQYSDIYNASIVDKYHRLMTVDSPKVILVAGSNFAFGINSQLIEDDLNLNVVNLGLHAGIKPTFLMNLSKENINEGDIVVLGLEYFGYYGGLSDASTLLSTIENYPYLWKCVDKADYVTIFKQYYIKYGMLKLNKYLNGRVAAEGVYSRKAFNKFGDIEFDKDIKIRETYSKTVLINKAAISENMINYINEYNRYIKSRGATLLITYPALDEQVIISNRDEIKDFAATLDEKLDAPIISSIGDYIMSSEYFFDTDYHLNNHGTEIRTLKLLEDLKAELNKN